MIGYRFIHALNRIATWVLGIGIVVAIAAIFVAGPTRLVLDPGRLQHRRLPGHGVPRRTVADRVRAVRLRLLALPARRSGRPRHLQRDVPRLHPGFDPSVLLRRDRGPGHDAGRGRDDRRTRRPPASSARCMLALFLLSVISHNALNLYGTVLSVITCVQTFASRWIPTARARLVVSVVVMLLSAYVAHRRLRRLHLALRRHRAGTARGVGAVDRDQPDRLLPDPPRQLRPGLDLPRRTAASTAASTTRRSWPTSSASWCRSRS